MPTIVENQLAAAAKQYQAGQFAQCVETLQEVLRKDHNHQKALYLLALSQHKWGRNTEATKLAERYTSLYPEDDRGWYSLGMFYGAAGQLTEALRAHQEAIKCNPDHVEALINAGLYLSRAGYFEHAIAAFRRALTIDPTNVAGCNSFANSLKEAGLIGPAIEMYQRTLKLQPNLEGVVSNLCYIHQFVPGITLSRLYDLHIDWDRRFGAPRKSSWPAHDNDPAPDKMLRVGFVSEDFRHHTVGHFLVGVLEHFPEDLAIYCYSLNWAQDEVTERFEAVSEEFRDARSLHGEDLFDCVRMDKIDVLFDLSGHTSGNRLLVFAQKPAPIQMTWLGYVGTTGLEAIDYKIGSSMSIPEGTEQWYSEQVLRFPEPFAHQCFQPGFGDVPVGPAPSKENGYVTFGTFSNSAKLNDGVLLVWAAILRDVPESRLLMKSAAFASEFTRNRITTRMGDFGIDPDRLMFEGFTPPPESLSTYNKIDVVLDPWPFSGCTTACEALWMGLPIVTWPKQTEASRHSASFLNALGMVDGIARDETNYCEIAVSLARNEARRVHLRSTLREDFLKSPACDVESCGQYLGDMIRTAWRAWCDKRSGLPA